MLEDSNVRLLKNTIVLYVRMIVVMVLNLYTSRLVLQMLGVDDYGLYNVVGGIVSLFAIINGALSAGTSRFITFEIGTGGSERLQETFSASFYIHLSVALVVLLLAETVGLWYVNNVMIVPTDRISAANWVYQFSIVTCIFSLTQVPYSASIIAHENMSIYAWVGIIETIIKLIAILLLLKLPGDKLIYYGLLLMFWNISAQVFYRFYCGQHYKECSIRWVKEKSYYKSMISFSLWDVMGNFTIHGHSQGINMLMNYFFFLSVNAAKGVAYQVQNVVNHFSNNFLTAVKPQIVKLFAEGNIVKMKKLVIESSRISFFMLMLIVLPLSLESNYILNLWLKEVPQKASLFLVLILVYSSMRSFATPIVHAVHATGNIKQLNLFGGGVSILINLPFTWLVYYLGAPAEATFYVLIISTIICNYIELLCLKKEIKFNVLQYSLNVYLKSIALAFPAIVCGCLIHILLDEGFIRLIIVTLTTTLLISVFAYFFGISKGAKEKIVLIVQDKILRRK